MKHNSKVSLVSHSIIADVKVDSMELRNFTNIIGFVWALFQYKYITAILYLIMFVFQKIRLIDPTSIIFT